MSLEKLNIRIANRYDVIHNMPLTEMQKHYEMLLLKQDLEHAKELKELYSKVQDYETLIDEAINNAV